MRKKILIVCMAILVLSFTVTSVSAVPPPIHLLPGQRINVLSGEGTEFETGETTHVVHGWYVFWGNMTREQKIEFVLTAEFYLYVNGVHVYWLRSALWFNEDTDEMHSLNFIVFDPYTFRPGTYLLRGVWHRQVDGVPESYENTVTVTVLA